MFVDYEFAVSLNFEMMFPETLFLKFKLDCRGLADAIFHWPHSLNYELIT